MQTISLYNFAFFRHKHLQQLISRIGLHCIIISRDLIQNIFLKELPTVKSQKLTWTCSRDKLLLHYTK